MRIGVLALLLAACADPRVVSLGSAELAYPEGVDFLPTALNFPRTQAVRVVNRSRIAHLLTVSIAPPFTAAATLEVPGGTEVALELEFRPTALGPATGTLLLDDVPVPVTGEGVEAPACTASSPCELVAFDPDSLSCVRTRREDGASCADELQCIEAGTCREGLCVGQAARCDDQNACTADACAPGRGCQHSTNECAAPTNPCLAPTCDPLLGCGAAPVQDGTPCGAVSCALANICLAGACRAVVPPEGFTCAPESACRGEGVCRQRTCVVPQETDLAPRWSYVSGDADLRFEGLTDAQGNWYWVECGSPTKPTNPTYRCTAVSFTAEGFERFRTDTLINGVPRGGSRRTQLLAGGLFIFVADEATLVAIDVTTGTRAWHGPLQSQLTAAPLNYISQLAEDGRGTLWVAAQASVGIRPQAVLSRLQVSTGLVQAETLVDGELGRLVLDSQGAALVQRTWLAGPVLAFALERYEPDGRLAFSQRLPGREGPAQVLGERVVLQDDSVRSARDGSVLVEGPLSGPWSFDDWPGVAESSTGRFRIARSIIDSSPDTIALSRVDHGARSELLTVVASDASDLRLTAGGDALFMTMLGLWNAGAETRVHQVHRLGQERMSCRLVDDGANPQWPLPVQYGGSTGFNGRWLAVRTTMDCPSCDFWGPPRLVFFDLGRTSSPGLAASGWVGPRGTPAGSHRAR